MINRAFQLVARHNGVKDELGISHMGHWVRHAEFCKTAYIEGNKQGLTRQELINLCKGNARSEAKRILQEMRDSK